MPSNLIAVVISDEETRKDIVKILSRNRSYSVTSQPFVPDIVAFLKSGGFNVAIIDGDYFSKIPDTDIKSALPSTNIIAWINKYDAQKAVTLISSGAMDVLTAPLVSDEVVAVVGYHLGGFYLKRKSDYSSLARFVRIFEGKKSAVVILPVIIAVLLSAYFIFKKSDISLYGIKEGVYTLNVQNPTGVWVEGGRVYVSDWISQAILGFKTEGDSATREVESYWLPECNPLFVSRCGDEIFTGSAGGGGEGKGIFYKYSVRKDEVVLKEKFSAPGPMPSGFIICPQGDGGGGKGREGRFAYSVDASDGKIYRHLASAGYPVVDSYNFAGISPVGIAFDGKYFYIADAKGSRIYKHTGHRNNFVPVAAYNVRLQSGDKEISGFFKSGKNFYIVSGSNPSRLYVISIK